MTLQLPLAALSTVNVVDTKYDSDSDFDYRPKPPRYVMHVQVFNHDRGSTNHFFSNSRSISKYF